jgi:hypothetical protein
MTEQEIKEYFSLPLPERFHRYMVEEMMSEEDYQIAMQKNGYDYIPILYRIKNELPDEFYMYFNDLLMDEELPKYEAAFNRKIQGLV